MSRPAPTPRRTDVRCRRCARTQPPLPAGVFHCLYCGTALPLQRWVATPPPGVRERRPARRRSRGSYAGPPGYDHGHPTWGFPPSVWRWLDEPAPRRWSAPVGGLRSGAVAAALTAVCCAIAAGGEIWRFALMLRGRVEVLSGLEVAVSDALVVTGSWTALICAMVTAVIAVPALVRAHRAAADFAGLRPPRPESAVWWRLAVPVVNAYGAGVILAEIEAMLATRRVPGGRSGPEGSGPSAPLRWWWACWVVSTALVLVTLGRAFGRSLQAIADTVQLHIAVDLLACAVAALSCWVLLRIARGFTGPARDRYAGWTVAPPAPTRDRPTAEEAASARRRSGVLPPAC